MASVIGLPHSLILSRPKDKLVALQIEATLEERNKPK